MYSFLISGIFLDLVLPFISSISISVTSSMICELVKPAPLSRRKWDMSPFISFIYCLLWILDLILFH